MPARVAMRSIPRSAKLAPSDSSASVASSTAAWTAARLAVVGVSRLPSVVIAADPTSVDRVSKVWRWLVSETIPRMTRHRSLPAAACLATVVVALAFAGGLAAPPAAHALTVGIGEQRPQFVSSTAFQRTRIGRARILVAWDAINSTWQRAALDQWFTAVQGAGITPLVTFGKSRTSPDTLPTPERYRSAINAFRARYPRVNEFSTWNEANACGERTCRRAPLVAAYWRQLRLACPGCTVLAADLVDAPNIGTWVRDFRRAASMPPTRWGLHNYLDANRFTTTFTRATLTAIGSGARLWLTETGGLVDRRNSSPTRIPEGFEHAARATGYLFDTIRRVSGRIQRIYFYNWIADPPPSTWDSAFLNQHLGERRSYNVLRDRLSRLARAGILTGRLSP